MYIYIYQSGCVRLDGFLLVVVIVVPLNSVRHPSEGQGNMARRSWLYCTSGASPRSRRLKLSRGLATRVLTCSDRDAEVRHEVQGYEDNRQGHDQGPVGGSACHQVGAQEEGLGARPCSDPLLELFGPKSCRGSQEHFDFASRM